MKNSLLILFLFCLGYVDSYSKSIVVSESDGTPVAGAPVISDNGVIVGTTDASGNMPAVREHDFPLTIRGIGVSPTVIHGLQDTIKVAEVVYRLPELTVGTADRPITRFIGYVRSYNTAITSGDTLQLFREFMTESFQSRGKVKGFKGSSRQPRILNERRTALTKSADGNIKKWHPEDNDEILMMTLALPPAKIPTDSLYPKFPAGKTEYSRNGKHGIMSTAQKKKDYFTVSNDALANFEGHVWKPAVFKLLGATTEFQKMETSYVYALNDKDAYGPGEFLYGTTTFQFTGLGKMFKKWMNTDSPVEFYGYEEAYPVEIQYLTIEEYKEILKNKEKLSFRMPENLQPLPQSVEKLIVEE